MAEPDVTPQPAATAEVQTPRAELLQSHARLHALAAASHAFANVATDYPLLLEKIASTTAETIGDGCIVTLLTADGTSLVNVANAHRDASLAADYSAYFAGKEISIESATVSATVARTGLAKLVSEIDPAVMVAQTEEALRPLVARLNVHSFAVVPIRARDSRIGTLSLVRSGPGRGYLADDLALLQDLADRAGLAIENARLYDDLERRVRQRTAELEALNHELEAFSYSVAHDLRAPLRTIAGFSHALIEDYADRLEPKAREYLQRTSDACERMRQLIDDLLGFARTTQGPLQRTSVDVSRLANTVLERLREANPARDVEVTVQPGLVADADPRLLEVVLTNLFNNAWKFSSKRARARIEFAAQTDSQPPIYRVRDDGAGFDSKRANKLFGVFQRLHTAHEFEGTGIGLATVQRIVRRHGGRVWAEAQVGRGATFYFTLEA